MIEEINALRDRSLWMNLGIDSVFLESALFTTSGCTTRVWSGEISSLHKRLVMAVKPGEKRPLSTGVNKPVY